MAEQVGGIYYEVDARTGNLIRSQRDVSQSTKGIRGDFERTERSGQRLNTTMTKVAKTIAGVFAVRQIIRFANETTKAIETQANFAESIGASFEQMQRLQFITGQAGATTEELNNSLRRLARRTEEAANGTGSAVAAFEQLGLNAKELQGLAPDEIFLRVADSFKELETSGQETSVAFGLFDTEGAKLINTLRRGRSEIEETSKRLDDMGATLSDIDSRQVVAAREALGEASTALRGVGNRLAVEMAPAIQGVSNAFVEAAIETGGFQSQVESTVAITARVIGIMADAVQGLNMLIRAGSLAYMALARDAAQGAADILKAMDILVNESAKRIEGFSILTANIVDIAFGSIGNLAKGALGEASQELDMFATDMEMRFRDAIIALNAQAERRPSEGIEAFLKRVKEESEAAAEAMNNMRNTLTQGGGGDGSDSFGALVKSLQDTKMQLQLTEDEWTLYQASMQLGTDATGDQARAVAALVRQINELRQEQELQRKAESVANSDLGLTRLQAREQQFRDEVSLLREAQAQQEELRRLSLEGELTDLQEQQLAKLESEVSYQDRINEIQRQYAEDRKQIIEDETETWKDRLDSVGFSFDSLVNQGVGGLASVAAGFQSGSDAARSFAQSVLTQALGALIRLALQSTILKGKEVGEAATAGAAIATAYTPAAIATNIASFGGAALAAAASAPIAATATVGAIQASSIGTGRLYGGGVEPGKLYPFMEDGRPEVVTANGKDYLFSPNRAQVTGNRDMDGMGGGANLNLSVIVNEAEGTSTTVSQQGSGMDRQVILDVVRTDIESYGTSTFGAMQKVSDLKAKTQF